MSETSAEIITLNTEARQSIFTAGQEAAAGYATLDAVVRSSLRPSTANESTQLTEIRRIVRGLFLISETLSEEQEVITQNGLPEQTVRYIQETDKLFNQQGLSDRTIMHANGALAMLANSASFVTQWNRSDPLARKTVNVHGNVFYQRPSGSMRLEERHESRRTLLTLPRVRLAFLMPATENRGFDLVLASDPEQVAAVKTDPDSALGRVFRTHTVSGLALSASGFLDEKMFVPSFTVVKRSWDNIEV